MIENDLAPPRHKLRAAGWEHSLATGAVGIALLHIERAHAGLTTWGAAHEWAAAITRNPISVDLAQQEPASATTTWDACMLLAG